jgi:cytochrome c peroxidase
MNTHNRFLAGLIALAVAAGGAGAASAGTVTIQALPDPRADPNLRSLRGVPVPAVPGLDRYVRDATAAVALGKALFWDMQAGSDGQACASCHFNAGADTRAKNQLNPGLNAGDQIFDPTPTGGGGPNYTLEPADFPFHRLLDPEDRNSALLADSNDVASSQGVFNRDFVSVTPGVSEDSCDSAPDVFHFGGINTRRVEPRNSPTVINAAFNFRNFWDGRANNVFNGVDPFGARSTGAWVWVRKPNGALVQRRVRLENSSLASQAVGPALSEFEMSCRGRQFADLGHKLLGSRPLALQQVDAGDGVLGAFRHRSGTGLRIDYARLIRQAFLPRYWSATGNIGGYSQMEANFSLFWGLAIQLYEATLISDDTPFDRFMAGDDTALTVEQRAGLDVFRGPGHCIACHSGPTFTKAARLVQPVTLEQAQIERMVAGDSGVAVYDVGFYNIGVRPTAEDRGLGGNDPYGNPLSFTRQAKILAAGGSVPDQFEVNPFTFQINPGTPIAADERDAIDGSFKAPGLRNVELTGPYFHNGGVSTLDQVVEFYSRGGDRRGPDLGPDTTGFDANGSNLAPDIATLGLTAEQEANLVAFMQALTDERVRWEMAPFDHPQLFIPNGHEDAGPGGALACNDGSQACDDFLELPAVGSGGRAAAGLPALQSFLGLDPGAR